MLKPAFHFAVKSLSPFSVAEFSTWPLLNKFKAYHPANGMEILVKPDGFMRLHEREDSENSFEHVFFFELVRSTEVQEILVTRAACYLDFYKSGGFAIKNGAQREDYRKFPLRVLMVFKRADRRNNTI